MLQKQEIILKKEALGNKLRGIRESKGIKSYYKMIQLTGLTSQQIKAIESGESEYTIDSFIKYLNAVEIELIHLLGVLHSW